MVRDIQYFAAGTVISGVIKFLKLSRQTLTQLLCETPQAGFNAYMTYYTQMVSDIQYFAHEQTLRHS
jgi:hypothetical protein